MNMHVLFKKNVPTLKDERSALPYGFNNIKIKEK